MEPTMVNEKQQTKNSQLIVFRQGNEEFGFLIDQIKEVVITPPITKVPLSPSYVRGVANIRGNIIAIVDMEERFGLKKTLDENSNKVNFTLVVESEDFKMGILSQEVPNTLAISESDIEQTPNIISDQSNERNYIKGIVKIGHRLIILIDIYKIINKEDVSSTLLNSKN
jgi:purine-binding chemotaxis protein CheW